MQVHGVNRDNLISMRCEVMPTEQRALAISYTKLKTGRTQRHTQHAAVLMAFAVLSVPVHAELCSFGPPSSSPCPPPR